MDELDRRILNRIQRNFPLVPYPFRQLATELGVSEEAVLTHLASLKVKGIIRHLGAVGDSQKLGFTSTLIGMSVPPSQLTQVVEVVNSYTEITHNYLREHKYNLWFTIIARSEGELSRIINEIKEKTGVTALLNLPADRKFKIKVDFDF